MYYPDSYNLCTTMYTFQGYNGRTRDVTFFYFRENIVLKFIDLVRFSIGTYVHDPLCILQLIHSHNMFYFELDDLTICFSDMVKLCD